MVSYFLKSLKAKGIKQKEIAAKTGLTQPYISELSRGSNCSLETAIKIADAFKVPLDTVIGREPPERKISDTQQMLLDITANDDEVARAALRCAQGEKLIKAKEGDRTRVKAA
jgi:transcriptional regulator with XRE-family HTH domain